MEQQKQPSQEEASLHYREIDLEPCCKATVDVHAGYNPMVVCPECKKLLKCFKNQAAFRNYVKFCLSRNRPVQLAYRADFNIVLVESFTDACR